MEAAACSLEAPCACVPGPVLVHIKYTRRCADGTAACATYVQMPRTPAGVLDAGATGAAAIVLSWAAPPMVWRCQSRWLERAQHMTIGLG